MPFSVYILLQGVLPVISESNYYFVQVGVLQITGVLFRWQKYYYVLVHGALIITCINDKQFPWLLHVVHSVGSQETNVFESLVVTLIHGEIFVAQYKTKAILQLRQVLLYQLSYYARGKHSKYY